MKKIPGFSLTEIIIVMAIIALLASLGIYGLSVAQRTSRDDERKIVASNISTAVDNYFRSNGFYPNSSTDITWSQNQVVVGSATIPLVGPKRYSATATDATKTRYFYQRDTRGYVLCTLLESGSWYKIGLGSTACPS